MWHWLVETLRGNPEIAIFLTLGLGFWAGKLKFGSFSLGVVTSTLARRRTGRAARHHDLRPSQIHVLPDVPVRRRLQRGAAVFSRPERRRHATGAVRDPAVRGVLLTAVGTGYVLGYDAGGTAGLLAGASTISAVLGVATGSIGQLSGSRPPHKQAMLDAMPVAYAVTYLFGTAGSAWVLATLGPKILRVDIAEECRKYEAQMGGAVADNPDRLTAYTQFLLRAYRLTDTSWVGRTVRGVRGQLRGPARVRRTPAPGRQTARLRRPTCDWRRTPCSPSRGGARRCWSARP
jgi:putative transport protein